jgi:hypothetical protein
VPALNPEEAILAAQASAMRAASVDNDLSSPFENHPALEVRVGIFGPGDSPEVQFGDWSIFRH